jgi:hypothetical protein
MGPLGKACKLITLGSGDYAAGLSPIPTVSSVKIFIRIFQIKILFISKKTNAFT